jgi:hypothetical protein
MSKHMTVIAFWSCSTFQLCGTYQTYVFILLLKVSNLKFIQVNNKFNWHKKIQAKWTRKFGTCHKVEKLNKTRTQLQDCAWTLRFTSCILGSKPKNVTLHIKIVSGIDTAYKFEQFDSIAIWKQFKVYKQTRESPAICFLRNNFASKR